MTGIKPKPHHHHPKVSSPELPPVKNDAPKADAPKPDAAKPADGFEVNKAAAVGAGSSAAPSKIDITMTSPDQAALDAMRKGTPAERDNANEIDNVRKNYKSLLDGGAKITLSRSLGNGGAPVLTLTPKALVDNPNQPFNTDVHYQGKYGTAAFPDPDGGVMPKIAKELNGKPPTVVVLPEPSNFNKSKVPDSQHRGPGLGFSPDWSNAKDPRIVADDALKAAGLPATGMPDRPLTVSAHSAGGRAVANAIARGNAFTPDKLRLEDCAYGDGSPSCAEAVKQWGKSKDSANCTDVSYVHSAEGGNGEQDKLKDGVALRPGLNVHRAEVKHHYDADFFPG